MYCNRKPGELDKQIITMGVFAKAVYEPSVQAMELIIYSSLTLEGEDGWVVDASLTTSRIAVFVNRSENIVVTAFRGTKVQSIRDIWTDINIITGTQSTTVHFREAVNHFDLVFAQYFNMTHFICGHSLGGTTAAYVMSQRLTHIERAFALNPGIGLVNQHRVGWLRNLSDDKINSYHIIGDPVSAGIVFYHEYNDHPLKALRSLGCWNPLKRHSVNQFIE